MYLKHKEVFYVFIPPSKFKSYTDLIKYVCRYVTKLLTKEKTNYKRKLNNWCSLILLSFKSD